MFPAVACQQACAILLSFCPAVAYQNGFQVDAKLCVDTKVFMDWVKQARDSIKKAPTRDE
jgi:hypothetical protein